MGPSVSYRTFIADAAASIRAYCTGDADPRLLHRLVDLASATVQTSMPGRLRATASTQATSTATLSTSLVSSLFPVNGLESPLRRALDRLGDTDDLGLFQLFRKIVVQTASNELFHRWAEYDPYSARLWRNLHRAIRLDNRLVGFPDKHPQWVALKGKDRITTGRMLTGHGDLISILTTIDLGHSSLREIAYDVISQVADIPDYCSAVAIEKLFSAVKEVSSQLAASELHHGPRQSFDDPISGIALNQALRAARQRTREKLHQYCQKCSMPEGEQARFESALDDLLCDCADGGQAQSYFQYLQVHWPKLTRTGYAKACRTRFEYLAKFAKQQLKEMVENERG